MKKAPVDRILFFCLFFTYAYFYQGGFSNQNSRFDLALSIAFEHRATIDSFAANTIDKVLVNGHYYLEKAPAASYLALPVTLVASAFLNVADLFAKPWLADLLLYLGTVTTVSLASALSAVAFRRALVLANPNLSIFWSTVLAVATFAATIAFPYSTMLFGHQLAASWVVFALYFGLRANRTGTVTNACACMFFAGMVPLTEYPAVVPLAGVLLAVVLERPPAWRRLVHASPVALVPASGVLLHNWMSFGGPFRFGYGRLQHTTFEAGMSRGLFGITWPYSC